MLILKSSTQELLQEKFADIIEGWYQTFLVEECDEGEGEKEEGGDNEDEYQFSDQPSSSPMAVITGKRRIDTFYVDANKRHRPDVV